MNIPSIISKHYDNGFYTVIFNDIIISVILLDRVTKKYGKKGLALDRVSLHIAPKEFVLIVGSSGAGKSTC
ncbi:MAG: cell division transport system ATP-binding protein [Patescibacteria group bacterium]|nr:cell division transport system ATP-binding protein [Patescibacteria group bacterium]